MRRRKLREFLKQIALGDAYAATLNRAERKQWEKRSRLMRFHSDESGKISFVSIFTLLAFVVMIVLVTNIGKVTSEKVALQNSADSVAYSTAVWPARSLNAITTANHLMGELTAMTVILDAFGGRYLENGTEEYDSRKLQTAYADLQSHNQHWMSSEGYISSYASSIDEQIVKRIVGDDGFLTSDEGKHTAGATIYDARVTLQIMAFKAMKIKSIANLGIKIGAALENTPFAAFGFAIEAASIGVHVWMTSALVEMGMEWLYLDAIESGISLVYSANVKRAIISNGVIGAISLYADTVVGSKLSEQLGKGGSPFNASVQQIQSKLESSYRLSSASTVPSWDSLELPVEQEKPPVELDNSEEADAPAHSIPESVWSGEYKESKVKQIDVVYQPLKAAADNLHFILKPLQLAAESLKSAKRSVFDAVELPENLEQALDAFDELTPLMDALGKKLPETPSKSSQRTGLAGSPCTNLKLAADLRLPEFDWRTESRSQWVRATYPYVDEFRAPVVGWFREHCEYSNAATYYVHWSNRYTLANSFEIRRSETQSEDSDQEKHRLIAELRKKVQKLRVNFEDATDQTQEENSGTLEYGRFAEISDDLMDVLSFRDKLPAFADWFSDVANHQKLIEEIKGEADATAGAKISDDTIRGIAEEMARVNILDDLLNLLEDFLGSLDLKEPHMYVLKGMTPESKGAGEPWLYNDKLAEELFVITAVVSKSPPDVFGPTLFQAGSNKRYALASAIVYNANGRDQTDAIEGSQPNTGWDTLNWDPPVRAFEWGDHKPTEKSKAPWDLIDHRALSDNNRVHLNWQVKLVPLRQSRINEIAAEYPDANLSEEAHALFTH